MSGAGASARRRGGRAVLCAALALAGVGAVLAVVAAREPVRRGVAGDERAAAPVMTALPATVASEAGAVAGGMSQPAWQPPLAAARGRRDERAPVGPERWESPSFDGEDWRERVAAALGRHVVEGAPRNPGAMHSHVTSVEGGLPEVRAPSLPSSTPAGGADGFDGWDGGTFWFGPDGLVRMKEAQP